MQITTVSANIRYSQDTGKGAWKVIELGAEGSVEAKESWQQAQTYLYGQLGRQLRVLWANGSSNGPSTAPNAHGGAEKAVQPRAEPEPTQSTRKHWCEEHQAEFRRREKDGVTWYSHRQGKDWCNEPADKGVAG